MIAALAAGLDAKDKLATLREHCRQEAARSDISAEGALANIILAIERGLFTLSEAHIECLLTESAHFRRTRSRNDRDARRKAQQRTGELPPPSAGADALSLAAHKALDYIPAPAPAALPPADPSLEALAREIEEDKEVSESLFGDGAANVPRGGPQTDRACDKPLPGMPNTARRDDA